MVGGLVDVRPSRNAPRASRRPRCGVGSQGQSLAEFTLAAPFLLILLLTIGDFGRFFAAGVRTESIARASAEIAAQEIVRFAGPLDPGDYATIHEHAWSSVCDEANGMAGILYSGPGVECDGIPTRVCVHDGADPDCGATYNAPGGVPAACPSILETISNAQAGGIEASRYVEVRVCYRFETALPMKIPFIGGEFTPLSGQFFIERTRVFTVADY